MQPAIGRCDRDGADAEGRGELPDRRKARAGHQRARVHRLLDGGGDGRCTLAPNYITYHYNIYFVLLHLELSTAKALASGGRHFPPVVSHNRGVTSAPADEYRRRLDRRRQEHERWPRLDARLAYARLVAFTIAVLVLVAAYQGVVSYWALLPPLLAFAVLLHRHDRVIRRREAAARAIAFYERGLARIEDRWAGTGEPGDRFRDDHHLYANDLDLFGRGSLFELLSIARTRAGEDALAAWLKTPASPEEIAARHAAIAELTPALDLREALGRAGAEVRAGVHTEALLGWAEAPEILTPRWLRWIARLFTAAVLVSIGLSIAMSEPRPFFGILIPDLRVVVLLIVAHSLFTSPQLRRLDHVLHAAGGAARDLDVLAHLLERLQQQPLQA